jgi:hypothetical protein
MMVARARARRSLLVPAAGTATGLAGVGLVGVGLWARREARRALARERIVGVADAPVTTASAARALAETIRANTIEDTGGRTYAEVEPYVDPEGNPTSDAARAAKDERTGQAVESPQHDLWIQSTALQTALMQAYVAFRLAELTVAIGAAFIAVGAGLASVGRPLRR